MSHRKSLHMSNNTKVQITIVIQKYYAKKSSCNIVLQNKEIPKITAPITHAIKKPVTSR